jgi:hypothetical protein
VALVAISITIQIAAVSVTQWRFWYHQEVLHQQTANAEQWSGQPFHWGPTRYHYYWVPSQSPILQQFVDLYQVVRLDTGDDHYLLSGWPDPYVSSPVPNYPLNTLLFWWADTRHPVLGPRTRGGIAVILGAAALFALLMLLRSLKGAASAEERPEPRILTPERPGPIGTNLPTVASSKD